MEAKKELLWWVIPTILVEGNCHERPLILACCSPCFSSRSQFLRTSEAVTEESLFALWERHGWSEDDRGSVARGLCELGGSPDASRRRRRPWLGQVLRGQRLAVRQSVQSRRQNL